MEYERQWANCSMSGTRSYALNNDLVRAILLLGNDGDGGNNIGDDDIDDDGDREERAWKQINQMEALFLKYNVYTLASDQALLSNRQMKRRIYMFAERILRERSQQQHEFVSQLYLVELVIDLNASEIQVRVKTSSPSSLDSSGGSDDRSISDFLSLLDQILVDLATPKNQVEGKKKRRRRGRGGANKQNGEEEGMDGVEETDAQPPAEEEKNSDKKNVSTGPIEENENELARYTHSGAQGSDPFSFEELDPQKCKALSSSL